MGAIECKLAMCISTLVEFELLLELKFEQKDGTSLFKILVSPKKSGLSKKLVLHCIPRVIIIII
jgi:hypothetical protein